MAKQVWVNIDSGNSLLPDDTKSVPELDLSSMVNFGIHLRAMSPNLLSIVGSHDDVIKWKHFPRYWRLCGEFTGRLWIPHTKASDAEL